MLDTNVINFCFFYKANY